MKAQSRWRWMSMPAACAAAGSSRAARSCRPRRLRWYAKAIATTATAPAVAWRRSVVSGTSESVVAPGPILVQRRMMLCVIPSRAKVAMPAARPESRINGSPATSAKAPPRPAASASDEALSIVWWARNGNRSVRMFGFVSVGTVISPAEKAPTATKLACPKESTPELPTNTYSATTMLAATIAFRNSIPRAALMKLPITPTSTSSRIGASSCCRASRRFIRVPPPSAATARRGHSAGRGGRG